MAERNELIQTLADEAINDQEKLSQLIDKLNVSARRDRQIAAAAINQVAVSNAELLVPYIEALIDAMNRPEAQTRWECMEALTELIDHDSRSCSKALGDAETALFDEESGPVRLAGMRFLCKLGSTTAARSEKVWPLIDEGIQCYHGDLEFNDMLIAIIDFSAGKLNDDVKRSLVERMSFDAANGKGTLKRRAQQIVNNAS